MEKTNRTESFATQLVTIRILIELSIVLYINTDIDTAMLFSDLHLHIVLKIFTFTYIVFKIH
jgi:hypothetical protein